jgi:hypothetical protein
MANVPKQQRQDLLNKAANAVGAGIDALQTLSNSGNPSIAAAATAQLVDARNVRDDLAVIAALVGNKPENALKPVSDADLAQLGALENSIDARIHNNQLISVSLNATTEIIQIGQSVGQILHEG